MRIWPTIVGFEQGHRDLSSTTMKNQILSTAQISKGMDFFLESPERDTAALILRFYLIEVHIGLHTY